MIRTSKYLLSITLFLFFFPLKGEELDWSFIRGGHVSASSWDNLDSKYIPGRFLVDVELNSKFIGKQLITITDKEKNALCFKNNWLREANIGVSAKFYSTVFDADNQCYILEHGESTSVDFDFSTQRIKLGIPQKGLVQKSHEVPKWDYGVDAVRMNYNANFNVNEVNADAYGSVGLLANIQSWLVTTSVGVTRERIDIPLATFKRALYEEKADLTLGKLFSDNALLGGAGLVGISLVSNNNMQPNSLGYSPVFAGVANSDARVSLIQNGSVVYSEIVPPGPFEIRNASLLSSGDVTMTITESDGSISTQLFPLTIIPNMLNPGALEYSSYVGLRDNGSKKLNGIFSAGGVGYGFDYFTLKSSGILHKDYQAFGSGIVRGLSDFGTVGFDATYSIAKYYDDSLSQGGRLSFSYAKAFNKTTSLQLGGSQYMSPDYVEFTDFSPWEHKDSESLKHKNKYDFSLSHQIDTGISVGFSGWRYSYWGNRGNKYGLNGSISAKFDLFNVSFGMNFGRSKNSDSYGTSLSIFVPLDNFGNKLSSFGNVSTNNNGSLSYSAGISSSLNDRFDYSASVGWANSDSGKIYSLRSNYRGERYLASGQLSQSGRDVIGSASLSGSLIMLPKESDIIFTRNISDTLVVANVADTAGVMFISSPYPSNTKGNAVIPVSSYRINEITVVGNSLPKDVELLHTSKMVVPTEGSVIYLPFETVRVRRYLFQIKDREGNFVPNGMWAESFTGSPLGFIAQNGVLFVNSIDQLNGFKIGDCLITSSKIKETEQLQEVQCEG